MNAGPATTDIAERAVGIGAADEPKGQAMTLIERLEKAGEGSLTSFTSSSFDASHRGPFADEIHGHTWFVEIGWKGPAHGPRVNAIEMKAKLDACLDQWDHKTLDDLIEPTNEGVAQAVGEQIAGLSEVTVWRKGRVPCRARWINNYERGHPNARAHRQEMETDRDGGPQ